VIAVPAETLGSRAFAVHCDRCGRSGPIVLLWRADDAESRGRGLLEAVDAALGVGFSITVSTEDDGVRVTTCLCPRCTFTEVPS